MKIDKGRLIKNIIIFVILAVVCMAVVHVTMPGGDLGGLLTGGLTFACILYFPVRMFPHMGLLGSIVALVITIFLVIGSTNLVVALAGETIGAIIEMFLLLAAFIASLLFL